MATERADDPTALAWRVAKAMRAADQAAAGAGVELIDVGPGRAVTSLLVEGRHVNGHGMCHGGYLFLLADSAFAYACNSFGVPTVAAGGDIVFLRPGRLGSRMYATAVLRADSGRSGVYDATVRADDPEHGEVVAESAAAAGWCPRCPRSPGSSQRA